MACRMDSCSDSGTSGAGVAPQSRKVCRRESHAASQRGQPVTWRSISAHVPGPISPSRCRERRSTTSGQALGRASVDAAAGSSGATRSRTLTRARCKRLFTAATLMPVTSATSAAERPSMSRSSSTSRYSGSSVVIADSRAAATSRPAKVRSGSGAAAVATYATVVSDSSEASSGVKTLRRRLLIQQLRAIA
jgi:hypothetical protein